MERPAAGTEGFLIRSFDPETGKMEFFFRVYETAAGNFTDYAIDIDDMEIQILDDFAAFYEPEDGYTEPTVDYNSKTLGRKKTNGKGN